jgi:putative membrane protein
MENMIAQCTEMMKQMMNGTGGMMGGMMNGGMMDTVWWTSPWYWGGWVLVLALLAAVVIAIVWAVRRAKHTAQSAEKPLDILKRRYAYGEIPAEQFETMKRQLSEA